MDDGIFVLMGKCLIHFITKALELHAQGFAPFVFALLGTIEMVALLVPQRVVGHGEVTAVFA